MAGDVIIEWNNAQDETSCHRNGYGIDPAMSWSTASVVRITVVL